MMKKILTIFCLATAVSFAGCSDDEEDVRKDTAETVSFTLTATLPARQATADDAALLKDAWPQGAQLAMMKTSASGVDKCVLTLASGDAFSGDASTGIYDDNTVAAFFPAETITASSSDTLTQKLAVDVQDGTPAGVSRLDYLWGEGKVDMDDLKGSASMEMKHLMHIGKFNFVSGAGAPMPALSTVTITATGGNLYASGSFSLSSGTFSSLAEGSIVLKNEPGLSSTVYVAFIPGEAQLHFTLVATDGSVYEAATTETVVLEKGKIADVRTLVCTPLSAAKVGDYYYSDGTWSTVKDKGKTCIGIVYALNDKDGNLDRSLTSSPYGRIVALKDAARKVKWAVEATDIEGLENHEYVSDKLSVACLPYYEGTADSYSSTDAKEWVKGLEIDVQTGRITAWPAQGVLVDFYTKADSECFAAGTVRNPAAGYAAGYSCEGKGSGQWYLPAAGDLTLIWTLHQAGLVNSARQTEFGDLLDWPYWTSSEWGEGKAWYVHFYNGMVVANSKQSTYHVRAVSSF